LAEQVEEGNGMVRNLKIIILLGNNRPTSWPALSLTLHCRPPRRSTNSFRRALL
jgi:hypothetical protein